MATLPNFITVEEYLAAEEKSEFRHEYWNGSVVAMAGASPTHADIVSNINAALNTQLKRSGCYVRSTDLRVRTAPNGLYTYPDLVISCRSQFDRTTLLNPIALVEILSEGTADYDRGSKFERYRKIQSFKHYVCIAQDCVHVEHHSRHLENSDVWTMQEYEKLTDKFTLPLAEDKSITVQVESIYDDLELGLTETPAD